MTTATTMDSPRRLRRWTRGRRGSSGAVGPVVALLLLVAAASAPISGVVNRDEDRQPGTCDPGRPCDSGSCCSYYGWCGNSTLHCEEDGCLSNCRRNKGDWEKAGRGRNLTMGATLPPAVAQTDDPAVGTMTSDPLTHIPALMLMPRSEDKMTAEPANALPTLDPSARLSDRPTLSALRQQAGGIPATGQPMLNPTEGKRLTGKS